MKSGFFQILMGEKSIPLTAFITPTRFYEWLVVPEGTSGSPGQFMRVMHHITAPSSHFSTVNMDECLVRSREEAAMVDYIEQWLATLTKHNLKVSPSKTILGAQRLTFSGHTIFPRGVNPDPKEIYALLNMPMPTNVSELRSLLGGLSYYRKFSPNLAKSVRPMNQLLKKGEQFIFTAEMESTVRDLLKTLASPPVLAFPEFDAAADGSRRFQLYCDASNDGFGACLEQEQRNGSVRPIVYLSRATFPNERN